MGYVAKIQETPRHLL